MREVQLVLLALPSALENFRVLILRNVSFGLICFLSFHFMKATELPGFGLKLCVHITLKAITITTYVK